MTAGGESVSSSPTVILIGGLMTLEHGEELDSRMPVEGDPRSRILCRALGESLMWWMTTSSLVDAILDSQGQGAFALVNGYRTVVEVKPDGRVRRIKLKSLIRGGVGTVRIIGAESTSDLRDGYVKASDKRTFGGAPLGGITGVDAGVATNRWRFLEGWDYSLAEALSTIRPTVIVDTDPDYILNNSYARYEESRLADGLTLVLPHTHATESYLRGVTDWILEGRPPRAPLEHWMRDGESLSDIYGSAPGVAVVSSGQFRVTGLYRRGEWQDPAELDAARAFVESRFDLRIGIWDLADNPSLRTSLLEPRAVTPAPTEPAPVPKGSARRSALMESARQSTIERRIDVLGAICEHFKLLRPLGWEVLRRPATPQDRAGFRLPLGEPVQRYGELTPVAFLRFSVGRYMTDVRIDTPHRFDLKSYLESKRDVLSQIAKPGLCDFGVPGSPILWMTTGGWGSAIDWPERLAELRAKTLLWLEVFDDLSQKLSDASVQRFGPEGPSPGLDSTDAADHFGPRA
jgi:hypothetical protein